MSVRKVYTVYVLSYSEGSSDVGPMSFPVFKGSYASCMNVYNAFREFFCEFSMDFGLCVAFSLD